MLLWYVARGNDQSRSAQQEYKRSSRPQLTSCGLGDSPLLPTLPFPLQTGTNYDCYKHEYRTCVYSQMRDDTETDPVSYGRRLTSTI
jgi:hypothetical protein